MWIRRISIALVIATASVAKAQEWDDYQPATGPGLGGHRNDGVALMLGLASGALGVVNLVPQPSREGARTLAGIAAVVGVGSAVAGEMMRSNGSARPGFATVATGFGVLTAAIGTTRLFQPARSPAQRIDVSPTIDLPRAEAAPSVGFSARVRF